MKEYTKDGLSYRYAALSETGLVRQNNEDSLMVVPEAALFGVCDGLGGHSGGEVASRLAADEITDQVVRAGKADGQQVLTEAIDKANRRIRDAQLQDDGLRGMATTVSLVWLCPCPWAGGLVANVGDSRVYALQGGKLRQVTEDHAPVFQLFKQGVITKAEMQRHPHKNLIDRCLGIYPSVEPDVFPLPLASGDRLVLASDGLTDCLSDDEIEGHLLAPDFEAIAVRLRDQVYRAGAPDNVTIILVEITRVSESTRR